MKNKLVFGISVLLLLLLLGGGTFRASGPPFTPKYSPIIFSDEFNRADNSTVNNGWMEQEQSSTDLTITNSQLRMSTTTADHHEILKSHGVLPLPYSMRTKITAGTISNPRFGYFLVESSGLGLTTDGLGLGFAFLAGTTSSGNLVLKHGTTDIFNTVARDLTGTFYLWVDVTPNGTNVDMSLYYSPTATKPSTPDVTITNIPHGPGADVLMLDDWTVPGDYIDVDYLFIELLAPQ